MRERGIGNFGCVLAPRPGMDAMSSPYGEPAAGSGPTAGPAPEIRPIVGDRGLIRQRVLPDSAPGCQGSTAKTPRNRGDFSGCAGVRAGSLRSHGLDGGGWSRSRTRLCCRFPDLQGKYREILRNWTLPSDPTPRSRRRSRSETFPVIRNRELVSTSRDIPASETALRAEATEPSHPPLSVGER